MKIKHPKRLCITLTILAVFSLPPFLYSLRLVPSLNLLFFNFTHSAPKGIYITAWDQEVRAGDYLVMNPPEEIKPYIYGRQWTKANRLLKRAAALEGEQYAVTDQWITLNEKRAFIYEVDPDNLLLPRLPNGTHTVPENQVLVVSWDVPSSFDSRYFGPIDKALIFKKVVPLAVIPAWLEAAL